MTNKDEYRKLFNPIEKEVFAVTHQINPSDFLRLGEVELINNGTGYRVYPSGYSSADYYNEFFGEADILPGLKGLCKRSHLGI